MLERKRRLEPLHVPLVVEEEEVAVLPEIDPLHLLESIERPQCDLDVERVGELRAKAARRLARRTGGKLVPFEQDDVLDARAGEGAT